MARRVMVQAGHNAPLQAGHEGQTGARGERELVREIQVALVKMLEVDPRFKPVAVPGRIPTGAKVDAALFLHADGSGNSTARGFSFGYPNFAVNKQLAELIADEFERIPAHPPRRRDNYTRDESMYYGFRHVDTPGPEVLVEHGFTSNPGEYAWLRANVHALAGAEYRALCRFFSFDVPGGAVPSGHGGAGVGGHTPAGRTTAPRTARAKKDARLRQGPDRSAPSIALVANGAGIAVTGSNGDWRRVSVVGWMHKSLIDAPARPQGTPHNGGPVGVQSEAVTLDTTLLGPARCTIEQVDAYLLARAHGEYSDDDVRRIVRLYFSTAGRAGLDPLIVLAQMTLETGHLTSFWSQRPRRNPAGIGVTGEPGAGLSFPDWSNAVVAHVGRLLAYALPEDAGNAAQRQLVADALERRPLPAMYRGAVVKIRDLGNGVWAADSGYRHKITELANAIQLAHTA